jgi:hypothetical protein
MIFGWIPTSNPAIRTIKNKERYGYLTIDYAVCGFKTISLLDFYEMITPERTIPHILAPLKQSKFRSKFKLTNKDRDYIADKGLPNIKKHAFQFVKSRIAPLFPRMTANKHR